MLSLFFQYSNKRILESQSWFRRKKSLEGQEEVDSLEGEDLITHDQGRIEGDDIIEDDSKIRIKKI
jgi:hypothetical protein